MKCDVVNCFPTNQKVTGSNPVGRAKQKALKHKRFKAFYIFGECRGSVV